MMIGKMVILDVAAGVAGEVRGGVYGNRPRIYGRLVDEGCSKDVAFVVIHPTNNFHGHYLLEPMQRRGRALLALNTRYVGNDSNLLVERAIQDLGAGVRFLREQGYKRVVLIGNSGGGALAALYQQQAEKLTITTTPDGRPIQINPADLPPADSVALVAAAPGRALTYMLRMDAAMIDENDLFATDPALDIFNPDNGPPFAPEFLERVRAAQLARNRRITEWCQARLRMFAKMGPEAGMQDQAFLVQRTHADPRHIDLSLDPSDRPLDKEARSKNFAPNNLGRFTTLRSWLSQWSYDLSRAKGPQCLVDTTVPVLMVYFTADSIVLPSYYAEWQAAVGSRGERVDMKGVGHYPRKEEDVERLVDLLIEWGDRTH